MAISREELIKKINDWRKDKNRDGLPDAYLEYLDSILEKEGVDTFATDPDTGEELDDYTPEFEAVSAEVMDDLGVSGDEIDEIMGNGNPDNNINNKNPDSYLNSISDGDGLDYYRYGPYTPEDEAKLYNNPEYRSLSEKIVSGLISGKSIEKLREEIGPLMSKRQKMAIDILHGSSADNVPDDPDKSSDKPHDKELAGETTLEEELLLKPNMPPEEFSKIAAEKRGAKKGEAAPDMKNDKALNNVLSDARFKNVTNRLAKNLSKHRW